MIFFKQKIVITKRFFFCCTCGNEIYQQIEFFFEDDLPFAIIKMKMKISICPNFAQGWMELHQYDLGFCW